MPSRRNTSAGRPRSSALNTATRAVNLSTPIANTGYSTVAAGHGTHTPIGWTRASPDSWTT
jgi:hypothetical protein